LNYATKLIGGDARSVRIGLLLSLSLSLLVIVATMHPWAAVDDAFITYRYADNLRHGLGFVYNPGEPVLGTTTPLYGFLLGGIGWLLPNVEIAAIGLWVSAGAWVAAMWVATLFYAELKLPAAALFGALLVASQPVMLTHLGMETALVVFLMLAAAWAWRQERWAWAVLCSALLILTRQDGALWVLLLGAEAWRRRRRLPWRQAIATIAICLPWFLFAYLHYGSVLPNSVLAKVGQIDRMSVAGASSVWQRFWLFLSAGKRLPYAFVLIAAAVGGVAIIVLRRRQLWWLPAWVVAYLLIYQMLGVISFVWYFLPPLVAVSLLAALGLDAGMQEIVRRRRGPLKWSLLAIASLLLIFLLAVRVDRVAAERVRFERDSPRLHPYHAVSQWLASHAAPDAVVASIEIGAIGYHTPNRILDTMGLVSPEMRPYLTGWSDSLVYAINSRWPDYAIVLPNTAWDGIVPQWWFQEHYEQAAQFENIAVYQRRSLPEVTYRAGVGAAYRAGIELTGASFASREITSGALLDGLFTFHVSRRLTSNLQFALAWVDAQTGDRAGQETIWPFYLESAWPAQHWPVGSTISMPVRLRAPDGLVDGAYRLGLLVYDVGKKQPLQLSGADDLSFPEVQLGYFRLGDPPAPVQQADVTRYPLHARWQDGIALSSVSLPDHPLLAGDVLPVRLDWQMHAETARDLTIFVHVLNTAGEIVAQNDRRPYDGRFPTTVWRADEALSDTVLVALPPDLPAGRYALRVGLYDEEGRLSREAGAGDSLLIESVLTIQSAP